MTLFMFLGLWWLPTIIAFGRGCRFRRVLAIALLCGLLSWTIVGWVFALIWSIDSEVG